MKIKPVGHRLLVKLEKVENRDKKSKGGIIIEVSNNLEAEQYATQEATVVDIGQTAFKAFDEGEPWCAIGDVIRIAKYAGENIKDEDTGTIYRIINDEDVFCIVVK